MHLTFMLWVAMIQALVQSLLWVITSPSNPVAWLSLAIFWGGGLFNIMRPDFDPLR